MFAVGPTAGHLFRRLKIGSVRAAPACSLRRTMNSTRQCDSLKVHRPCCPTRIRHLLPPTDTTDLRDSGSHSTSSFFLPPVPVRLAMSGPRFRSGHSSQCTYLRSRPKTGTGDNQLFVVSLQMKLRHYSPSTLMLAMLVCSVLVWLASSLVLGVLRSRELSANAQYVHKILDSVGGGGFSLVRVHGAQRCSMNTDSTFTRSQTKQSFTSVSWITCGLNT